MIEIRNLEKKYKNKIVLNNINYIFSNGIYVINGKNGSGKSTLLKCICKLIMYKGNVETDDDIFYLPEHLSFPMNLKSHELLLCYKKIENNKDSINDLIKKYNLRNDRISKLSKGMKQKIGIIMSFISDAKILLYDEPLEGLDVNSIKLFIDDLKRMKNKVILLNLHEIPRSLKNNSTLLFLKDGFLCEN